MERPTASDGDDLGIDGILKLWNVFDTNLKGSIGQDELAMVLRELEPDEWDDKRMRDLLAAVDTNKDGMINVREFFAFAFGNGEDQEAFRVAMNLSVGPVCEPGESDGFFWSFMTFPQAPDEHPLQAAAISIVRAPLAADSAAAIRKEAELSEPSTESGEEEEELTKVVVAQGRKGKTKAKAKMARGKAGKKKTTKSAVTPVRQFNAALLTFGGQHHMKAPPSLVHDGAPALLELLASGGMCHLQPWLAALSPVKPGSLVSVCHEIMSFPPEPRVGFSLTPLDDSGRKVLLLGGYSARGSCLDGLHILDFSTAEPLAAESESESDEDIFFVDDFRTEVCSGGQKEDKSKAVRGTRQGRPAPRPLIADEDASSGTENEEPSPISPTCLTNGETKVAMTSAAVLAALDGEQVRFHRCDQLASNPSAAERAASREAAHLARAARWRAADQHAARLPEPRAGHAAAIACPTRDLDDAIVFVHGGLNSIGGLLSDMFEVHVCENFDGLIDAIWHEIRPSAECSEHCLLRAFHSAVLWPGVEEEGQHSVVLFGGMSEGLDDAVPYALQDIVLLTCRERELPSAGTWSMSQPRIAGPLPPARWGHCASLAGGTSGGGTTMILCAGIDAQGVRLSDCWTLDLESMCWTMLEEPGIPRGLPAIGLAPCVWSDDWNAMVIWGASTTGLINEAEVVRASRFKKVRDRIRARRLETERQAKRASRAEASARQAAERAEQEERQRQQKEKRAAELAKFAEKRRLKLRADTQAQKDEEKKRSAHAEEMKKLRRGGGFDMKKAAALRNTTAPSP